MSINLEKVTLHCKYGGDVVYGLGSDLHREEGFVDTVTAIEGEKTREKPSMSRDPSHLFEWTAEDWEHFWDEVIDTLKLEDESLAAKLKGMKIQANIEHDKLMMDRVRGY